MKGLIIKEFVNISKSFWVIGALIVFYGVIAIMTDSPSSFSGLFTLIFAMFMLSTYSLDEMAKWDSYALTMPISRDNIIQGKYLMMLILSFMGFLVNGAVLLGLNIATKTENLFNGIEISVGGVVVVIIFYSIIIPVITKLGILKARIYFIIIYMIPFLLGSLIFRKIEEGNSTPPEELVSFIELIIDKIYIIAPLGVMVALGVSYCLSIRIYRKKEF